MDEKLSEKHAKKEQFYVYVRAGKCRERRYVLTTYFFQIYFRMNHFVIKFSSPQAAWGIDPSSQNPADVPVKCGLCLLDTTVSFAKMAQPIEVPFG